MAWQCFTEGYESLFQSSFADNNTLVLEGFVTVHEEKSLGWPWRQLQLAINNRYRRESRYDDLVVSLLWLLGPF